MAGKRISQLDVISGAAVAADDSFIVFDTSTGITKRVLRSELAVALSTNLIGAGLEADGLGSIKIRPDTTPGSAVLVTGAGLAVGVGNTNAEHVGLRSRNQSAGNAATSVAELSTGAANVSVRFEVLNNDGAPIGRMIAGSALASWQHRAGVHIFYNQAGTTEYGRLSSTGLQVSGLVESTANGFRFPDGSTQTTAASSTPVATESVAGKVELATDVEVNAGTDTTRVITPASLSNFAPATVVFAPSDKVLILDASDSNKVKQASLPNRFLQQVGASTSARSTATALTPHDNTKPLYGEGTEILTVAITPQFLNSVLLIEVNAQVYTTANAYITMHLHRQVGATPLTSTDEAVSATSHYQGPGELTQLTLRHRVVANSLDQITFRVRVGPNVASTLIMNGDGATGLFDGVSSTLITVTEIAA